MSKIASKLTLKTDSSTWYPHSIANLDEYISLLVQTNMYFSREEVKGIKKNIAYSLQYIEFLHRVFEDINLSSVLFTQNVKSFVVHGASIIEAICNYLVISKGYRNKTSWNIVATSESQEYNLDSKKYKNKIEVYEKLESEKMTQMTFDQLIKKVEAKKLLGQSFPIYSKIKPLRELRNKIHIHDSVHGMDTDWYSFGQNEYALIREVLYEVLTSEVFNGCDAKRFNYLK